MTTTTTTEALRQAILTETEDSARMRASLLESANGWTAAEERIIKDALAERGIVVTTPDRGIGEWGTAPDSHWRGAELQAKVNSFTYKLGKPPFSIG